MITGRKSAVDPKLRAWLGGIIALACTQAWLSGTGHAYCANAVDAMFSIIELEIVVPTTGLTVAACAAATAFIASAAELRWQLTVVIVLAYGAAAAAALSTVETHDSSRAGIVGAVVSAIAVAGIGLSVRRLPPLAAAVLGVGASVAIFMVTYSMTAYTGATACGFAP